ncbi:MAG: ABC transporter ATP-binding protein [Clostridia bacterium]
MINWIEGWVLFNVLRKIASYLKPYKKSFFAAVVCVSAEAVFELIIPLIMADIIDIGVKNGDKPFIFIRGGIMILCALLALLLGIGSAKFSAKCGNGLGAELRKEEYRKLQGFSFSNIDNFRVSSLVTRLTSDITAVQTTVSSGLRPACRAPVMMTTAVVASFLINAKMAVVFLIATPVLAVLLFLIVQKVRPMYSKLQKAIDKVNLIVQENLTAIRVVKAFVRRDVEEEKFREANEELQNTAEYSFKTASLNMPAMQLVMYATILCILGFGGKLITIGGMEVGELTGFLSYVLQVLNSLMMISNVFLMMTRSLASCKRIVEVIDEKPALDDTRATDAQVRRGAVSFRNVSFKYSDTAEEYVLYDINLEIAAGETIGIIGPTGSAKTTLVQLIPRLYEASAGTVSVDGRPVWEYTMRHLRDAIAMVLQNNTLFTGTIRENLKWGKEDATDAEIEEACRIACADEFISGLQYGYETELGQGGVNVSGGQKQRLCIARALLKKPKILILDDSTSAVDTVTESKIREGLAAYLPETTKIIIAQRISSVSHADRIVILDNGRIDAVGSHEELLAQNEIYRDIYESQRKGEL